MSAHPDFWVVLHTRMEQLDHTRLETRGARAETLPEAYDLLCEMACLTEAQRHEHGLFMAKTDILELCTALKALTGDDFEAMIYEEFVSKRTSATLPVELQIEMPFVPRPKDTRTLKFHKHKPLAAVFDGIPEQSHQFGHSWVHDTERLRLPTGRRIWNMSCRYEGEDENEARLEHAFRALDDKLTKP